MTLVTTAISLPSADLQPLAKHSKPAAPTLQFPTYRPEIDGLRAFAVLVVILCHAQFRYFSGGYVGVDVFFTISGYVVALAIFRDQANDKFTLANFYSKRLRRLAPSLYLMLFSTIVFCLIYCFPQDTYAVIKNSLLVSVFYSNIYLAKQTGYFDVGVDKQALLHTWSLSVEEQFYLLFPILLLGLRRTRSFVAPLVFAVLFIGALTLSQHAVTAEIAQSYYKLQYRIFEFLLGTMLALAHQKYQHRPNWRWSDLMFLSGLIVIAWTVLTFNAATPIPGWHTLLPCFGAALIIAGGRNARFSGIILNNRGSVYLGKLSYVLYLWHWPVMFALRRLQLTSSGWMCFAIALSLGLSVLTHHLLEQPLRSARWSNQKTFLILFVSPVVMLGTLMFAANKTDNFIRLYPEKYRVDYAATGRSVFDDPRAKQCWSKTELTTAADCSVGNMNIPVNAVFWGDSHAYHQIEFIDAVGKNHGLHIHDMAVTMCPPNENGPLLAGDHFYQSYRDSCLIHNRAVMAYILSTPEIKTVIMSAVWQNYENPQTGSSVPPNTHGYLPGDDYLALTLEKLTKGGKNIVFLDDIPIAPPELENCQSNKTYLPFNTAANCSYDEKFAIDQHAAAKRIIDNTKQDFPAIQIIHTFDVPCANGKCETELLHVPMYRNNDTGHLGSGGSRIYYQAYLKKHPLELDGIFSQP